MRFLGEKRFGYDIFFSFGEEKNVYESFKIRKRWI